MEDLIRNMNSLMARMDAIEALSSSSSSSSNKGVECVSKVVLKSSVDKKSKSSIPLPWTGAIMPGCC